MDLLRFWCRSRTSGSAATWVRRRSSSLYGRRSRRGLAAPGCGLKRAEDSDTIGAMEDG